MNRDKVLYWVAAACGMLSVVLLRVHVNHLEKRISGGAKVSVVVAKTDLERGARIDESLLTMREIPRTYLDARQIGAADVQKLVGVEIANNLLAGEALVWSDVAATVTSQQPLSGLITRGKRAMTVPVEDLGSMGAMIRPGDRVDVLYTPRGGRRSTSRSLLQRALVLAVGADFGGDGEVKGIYATRDVTLSLYSEQAEMLYDATSTGKISLTLRNPLDSSTTGVSRLSQHLDFSNSRGNESRKNSLGRQRPIERMRAAR